jgi:CRP-like cAMP-binding protein
MELAQGSRINQLDLFAGCSRSELRSLDTLFTHLVLDEGQVLIREGAAAKEFIVIADGTARVTRETDAGVVTVADVASGDFLGEMGLLNASLRAATVTATSELSVLVCSASEFRSMLRMAPSVADRIWQTSLVRAEGLAIAA